MNSYMIMQPAMAYDEESVLMSRLLYRQYDSLLVGFWSLWHTNVRRAPCASSTNRAELSRWPLNRGE